ncbi:hypothetical protein RND71_008664 [Anisodus tanguticus]|uniref:Uncharacterized protein n=1 Tax=Anisodus tanguticus TaxID=243964 RepID=A0AAE1SP55_9SOLA|nr:hypothetical protein RND71_008664 [Anisodus tanguticus]
MTPDRKRTAAAVEDRFSALLNIDRWMRFVTRNGVKELALKMARALDLLHYLDSETSELSGLSREHKLTIKDLPAWIDYSTSSKMSTASMSQEERNITKELMRSPEHLPRLGYSI